MTLRRLVASFEGREEFPIEVDEVRAWLLEQGFQDQIDFFPVEIDAKKLRGSFYRFRQPTGVYSEPREVTYISFASGLNICWRRFVCCKEMMHLFDDAREMAGDRAALEILLRELGEPPSPQVTNSAQFYADQNAIVKALTVLAPLPVVEKIRPAYVVGTIDDYDVALFFRVPQYYVKYLMSDRYKLVWDYLITAA